VLPQACEGEDHACRVLFGGPSSAQREINSLRCIRAELTSRILNRGGGCRWSVLFHVQMAEQKQPGQVTLRSSDISPSTSCRTGKCRRSGRYLPLYPMHERFLRLQFHALPSGTRRFAL